MVITLVPTTIPHISLSFTQHSNRSFSRNLMLSLQIDRNHHSRRSIVPVVMTMMITAATCVAGRQTAATAESVALLVAIVAALMAALVVVMMVALLFALHAHIGHHHFGTVAQTQTVAAEVATAAVCAHNWEISKRDDFEDGMGVVETYDSRFSRDRLRFSRDRPRAAGTGSSVSLRRSWL